MGTDRGIIGGAVLVAVLGVGGYWYWSGEQPPPIKYKTAKIERGTVTQVVMATGTINPVITVQVGSQVSGIIQALFADFNSVVKAGQVVAQLDPVPFRTKVTEMDAILQNAQGNLARARADLALQTRNFDRASALFEQSLNAQQDVDNTRAAYESAQATVHVADAQVKQAQAQLETAKVNLAYTTIRAPVNGIVISRNVDVGQTVAASFQTPVLFTVAKDLTKMQVDTHVSESDIGGLTEGKPATFVVDAYPDHVFTGAILQVRNAPITVQNVVTYNVVVGVENPDLRLRPGMTANVSIMVARQDDVLKVPNQALRFKPAPAKGGEKPGGPSAVSAGTRDGAGKGGSPEGGRPTPKVWLRSPQGEPTPVEVTTGITDGVVSELIEGAVKEGEDVIIGLEMPKGPYGSSLPPGFGSSPSQRPSTGTPRGL